jgi:precorrin-2/cobalt-factor-2 C20-methyltransferase
MIGEESVAVVSLAKRNNENAEKVLDAVDNLVIMKAFASIPAIVEMLKARNIPLENATVMSNVGMPDEYIGPLDPSREYGYFTTVLIKKKV